MSLLRVWERRYAPSITGRLRLTSAKKFRDLETDAGIGDIHEGGQRLLCEHELEIKWQDAGNVDPFLKDTKFDFHLDFEPKPVHLKGIKAGTTKFVQEVNLNDSGIQSPYILCLSHEPQTEDEWMLMKHSFPYDRDLWTYISEHRQLKIEIECGIYRWLKLQGAASHRIKTFWGPVQYIYNEAPVPKETDEHSEHNELLFKRWLRKRKIFQGQKEFRFGFYISSPEVGELPDHIDIELTRTGIGLFQDWEPNFKIEKSA